MKPPRKRPVTVSEAAAHAGTSARNLYNWINAGLLPAVRQRPKGIIVDLNDVDQLMQPVPVRPGELAKS